MPTPRIPSTPQPACLQERNGEDFASGQPLVDLAFQHLTCLSERTGVAVPSLQHLTELHLPGEAVAAAPKPVAAPKPPHPVLPFTQRRVPSPLDKVIVGHHHQPQKDNPRGIKLTGFSTDVMQLDGMSAARILMGLHPPHSPSHVGGQGEEGEGGGMGGHPSRGCKTEGHEQGRGGQLGGSSGSSKPVGSSMFQRQRQQQQQQRRRQRNRPPMALPPIPEVVDTAAATVARGSVPPLTPEADPYRQYEAAAAEEEGEGAEGDEAENDPEEVEVSGDKGGEEEPQTRAQAVGGARKPPPHGVPLIPELGPNPMALASPAPTTATLSRQYCHLTEGRWNPSGLGALSPAAGAAWDYRVGGGGWKGHGGQGGHEGSHGTTGWVEDGGVRGIEGSHGVTGWGEGDVGRAV